MQYQLEAMRDAGIEEVAIVIGPGGDAIGEYFGHGEGLGISIDYIEDLVPSGIAASLALAEQWVCGPFALFLGDIFLALDDLGPALSPVANGASGSIVVRRDTTDAVRRNFAVVADAEGRVSQVVEKPAHPPTDQKGCGVYVFEGAIFDAARRTPRSSLRNEYELTDAVQTLVEMGCPVYATEVVRWDVNVTYPEDLLACNLRLLRERQLDCLIGPGARINPAAQIQQSVVGGGAAVDAPVTLEECVVLPEAHVDQGTGPIRRRIFADGLVWAADGAP
jgi:dTDP-glucose pyrophosphorylase